ncbi:MAG: hypothetical protein CMJ64_18720 [Planctomycetaceae bacterium]|nr:hypothetical protein [Planctomycetaceae bacterium]
MDLQIRPAELRDHPVLAALMLRLDFGHREYDGMELSVEQLDAIIASEHEAMIMTDKPLGFVHVSDANSPHATASHRMYVNNLYVFPHGRRKGVGTRLMYSAFDWGREREMTSVRLHVWSKNAAASEFYAVLGFEQVGDAREREL